VVSPRNDGSFRVGDLDSGGELAGGLRNDRVWVNASNGLGLTVELELDDAEVAARCLLDLVRQARGKG
jgi:hypothetical protein